MFLNPSSKKSIAFKFNHPGGEDLKTPSQTWLKSSLTRHSGVFFGYFAGTS